MFRNSKIFEQALTVLSDVEEVDKDNASSSNFADVSYGGLAHYADASGTYRYVRPRFVIRDKDR